MKINKKKDLQTKINICNEQIIAYKQSIANTRDEEGKKVFQAKLDDRIETLKWLEDQFDLL